MADEAVTSEQASEEVDGFFNPEPEAPARPRNPDGTFAPVNPEPEPPPAPPSPRPNGYRTRLLSEATEMGFSEDELKDMPDAAISTAIHRILRDRLQTRAELARAQAVNDAQERTPQPAPNEPDEDELELGPEAANFDPAFLNVVKKVAKKSGDRIKALETQLAEERQRNQERDSRAAYQTIDQAFDMLGDGYQKLFGEGSGSELVGSQQQRALARRVSVLNELTRTGGEWQKLSPRQLSAKLKQAADLLYGADQPAKPKQPTAADPYAQAKQPDGKPVVSEEEWAEGGLAPATHRRPTAEPKGDKLAIKNLKKALAEEGIGTADNGELEEFFTQGS